MTIDGQKKARHVLSEQELLEELIEDDPNGEVTEWDWVDFWATETYIEDTEEDEDADN